MARQRFIKPSMWTDKTFGSLTSEEKLLFISLFSLADDEGRISAEPMFLKASTFPYDSYSVAKVTKIRDGVVAKMPNVWLYEAKNEAFIALLKWPDHQKPKYPQASKIPPPFPEDSANVGGTFPEASPNVSPLDRDGLGRDGLGEEQTLEPEGSSVSDTNPSQIQTPSYEEPPAHDDLWANLTQPNYAAALPTAPRLAGK